MSGRFEDRHRELRNAWLQYPARARLSREDLYAADRAEEGLQEFDQRTGPLVDDLVAAVREERRLSHRMDAYSSRDLRGDPPTITTLGMEHDAVIDAVEKALAALDEASRG